MAPLAVIVGLLSAGQDSQTYELTAKLKAVGPLGEFKGEILSTGQVDAAWFIQLDVEKVSKGKCPGSSGKVVAFAIHSPSSSYEADLSKEGLGESFEIKGTVKREKGVEVHALSIRTKIKN